ncbi:MAG: hypothetical protein ABEK84_04275, partial [Salinibacter sp.]
ARRARDLRWDPSQSLSRPLSRTMEGRPAVLSWSGGKDAALCLHRALAAGTHGVAGLLTTASERYGRSSQHGVRMELLQRQAQRVGLPLQTAWLPPEPSMDAYDRCMKDALTSVANQGVDTVLFGDIFLEDLRSLRERRLAEVGMTGAYPLWQRSTEELARAFLAAGFRAVVVCASEKHLGREFVGHPFDQVFLEALPDEVDPCGEHGEFHTFVYDGPIFSEPIAVERGDVVYRTYDAQGQQDENSPCPTTAEDAEESGFWYCDLLPEGSRNEEPPLPAKSPD